jgi:LysM domain-containing protein
MGSLTAHLLETGDHGRLRFHPSCPVCRQERLYGTLSTEPVVSRRTQALLAGGVLAFSASAPAVGVAQERDRQFEGVAAPEGPGAPELDDPTFDPGGDTALPFDSAPAPAAPSEGDDSGDGAPLDVEPMVDLDARLAPLADMDAPGGETGAPATDEQSDIPPGESVPPVSPRGPTGAAPDGTPHPGAGTQPTDPNAPGDTSDRNRSIAPPSAPVGSPPHPGGPGTHWQGSDGSNPSRYTAENVGSDVARPAPVPVRDLDGLPPASAAAPASALAAASASAAVSAADQTAIAPSDNGLPPERLDGDARFYVVQPGDSLWSIAKRLLGRDASAGRIAREVNRLWSLNRSRIATGDPDLLRVGTRLDLR